MTRRTPPPYFDRIREEARRRWDQLERDPVLAAPWRQLFQQVRSPRHVLSELLQNADDAGATSARAEMNAGTFVFAHNGSDFTEDQFRSLCQFGFSNKRHLHTIGFRGLGFKSLFGLGNRVRLSTPTLAVEFSARRFTEPSWVDDAPDVETTVIEVPEVDGEVTRVISEEFQRWSADPTSLLFFSSLRRVSLQDIDLAKEVTAAGPIPNSERVHLHGRERVEVLHIWSPPGDAPADVLAEVRQERADPEFLLPPITVHIALGGPGAGRVYVVLPTDLRLALPFSVEAPFLQDPARTGIKDPASSHTNRWLLDRIGALAREALSHWLANDGLSMDDRARAYELLPLPPRGEPSLGRNATERIFHAMCNDLRQRRVILTSAGALEVGARVLDLPAALSDVWHERETLRLFAHGETGIVAPQVSDAQRDALAGAGALTRFDQEVFLQRLTAAPPPGRPDDEGLVRLWAYLAPLMRPTHWDRRWRSLCIVPLAGRNYLGQANAAERVTAIDTQLSGEDVAFLGQFASLVAFEWIERFREGASSESSPMDHLAYDVLRTLGLDRASRLDGVFTAAATAAIARGITPKDGVHLARLAARMDVSVDSQFPYITSDGALRRAAHGVLVIEPGVEALLPDAWRREHVLHSDYEQLNLTCDVATWREWSRSPRSQLRTFPLPEQHLHRLDDKQTRHLLDERGGRFPDRLQLKSNRFRVAEYDFAEGLWGYWSTLARSQPGAWTEVVRAVGKSWDFAWSSRTHLTVEQLGSAHEYRIDAGHPVANWVKRLRSLPCVVDDAGQPVTPATVMRRTPSTVVLEGIEPFLDRALEESCGDEFLDLLGVRADATSPGPILERLLAQSQAAEPSLPAVFELYRALDRMSLRLTGEDLIGLKGRFSAERLIRANDGTWQTAAGVYQRNPSRLPACPVVWELARDLGLWSRMGVQPVPTPSQLLAWLTSLPQDARLPEAERERVKLILAQLPDAVWRDVGCWIAVGGWWMPTTALRWRAEIMSAAEGLFEPFRKATADASILSPDQMSESPLRDLPPLDAVLHWRIDGQAAIGAAPTPEWLTTLASCLMRVPECDATQDAAGGDRRIGGRMLVSRWANVPELRITPFVSGEPIGPSRRVKAAWIDDIVCVSGTSASHHTELVGVLQGPFVNRTIREAIAHCVGRDPQWIVEYFTERWELLPETIAGDTATFRGGAESPSPPRVNAATVVDASPALRETREDRGQPSSASGGRPSPPPRPVTRDDVAVAYFRTLGFELDGPSLLRSPTGNVVRLRDDLFDATEFANGVAVRFYWIADHPLEEGVEVPAEIWHALLTNGESAVILARASDDRISSHRVPDVAAAVDVFASRFRIRIRIQ